jgi:membrane-associated protein
MPSGSPTGDDAVSTLIDAIVGLPPWLVLVLVFALPAAEAGLLVGVFIPGEVGVLLGGVVAHEGGLPLYAVIAAAALGAVIGDQVGYLLGRRYGGALATHLPSAVRRSGDLDRALDLIRRRGAVAVALGRWTAVLRALVPGAAGTSGMARARFTVANLLGGTLWAAAVAVAGYLAGASYRALERNLGIGGDAILAAVVVVIVLRIRARRHRGADSPDQQEGR